MQHYVIRHAHAVDLEPDVARPLSDKGRRQVARLARQLAQAGAFTPAEIWHSPLLRARETAELLVAGLGLATRLREVAGLRPDDDPRAIARLLAQADDSIAVVGHEPHLGMLASQLLVGDVGRPVVLMKKCAALAVDGAGAHWRVHWHLVPEVVE